MLDKIKETALWLKTQAKGFEPKIAIILGSGLGNLEKEINKLT